MRLSDMIIGRKYWVNDGYGYDLVECVEHNPKEIDLEMYGAAAYWVKIRYVDTENFDFFGESPGYSGLDIDPA